MIESPPQDPSFQYFGALVLKERLDAVQAEVPGVREGKDHEFIHRIRVASRRLRSALDVFASVLPAEVWDDCQKPLKKITRQLGEARDADVQIEFLESYVSHDTDPSHRPGLDRLMLRLRQHRTSLQSGVLDAMDRLGDRRIIERMTEPLLEILAREALAQTPRTSPALFKLACPSLAICLENMLAFTPHIQRPENHDEHHQMRIAAKKLRYTLELFGPLFNKDLKTFTETVKEAQSVLGEIHDADVWVAAAPQFLRDEERRIEDFFGTTESFGAIAPGVLALRDERYNARLNYFAEFTTFWKQTEADETWVRLKNLLVAKMAEVNSPTPAATAPLAPPLLPPI